jgi:hypothetical protein
MAQNDAADPVVANPTYMADIRTFFTTDDVTHMAGKGYDLATYDGVKNSASDIYAQTQTGMMPPPPAPAWSADKVQTFLNWMTNKCPLGSATAAVLEPSPTNGATAGRVRKNVANLSDEDVATLKAAFSGLMGRDASDPGSYYALAGIHQLPGGWDGVIGRCQHHVNPFNPWHRVYLKAFEDALRSVPGCEDVTLPYWDISTPLPQLLQEDPYASYTLPEDPGGYPDYTTQRYPSDEIERNLEMYGVPADIATSLQQSLWGAYSAPPPAGRGGGSGYQQFSIQAHDGGHVSVGPTMGNQDVAAFDPVFWFYHSNLDRLWLKWQQTVGATTLIGFKSTLGSGTAASAWLSPPINGLAPFSPPALTPAITTDETIDLGISYDDQEPESAEELALENTTGSIEAARSFSIKSSSPVSVRVKNIDRLNIPGSFVVNLLADGETIAKRAVFQPTSPRDCETCRSVSLISLDFRIEQEKLLDKQLSVEIEVPGHKDIGMKFPLSKAGNPTINARLLLHDD